MRKSDITEILKNTLIMLAITIVAGGLLGVIFELTKAPIAAMEEKTRSEANARVFVDAASFEEVTIDEENISKCGIKEEYPNVDITDVLRAVNADGETLGHVVEVTTHEGFNGDIVLRVGIQNDGTVNAIYITEISETPNLGMRAPDDIVPQFVERRSDSFEVVKGTASLDNQIAAISGATITSKAVVRAVNASLLYHSEILNGGDGDE